MAADARARYLRTLHAELGRAPAARAVLSRILDRRDRRGGLGKSLVYAPRDAAEDSAVKRFLPAEALRRRADGKLVVDLARLGALTQQHAGLPLDALLAELLHRELRNLPAEESYRREHVAALVTEGLGGACAGDPEVAAWRDAELGRAARGVGELMLLARRESPAAVRAAIIDLARAVVAARAVMRSGETVRLANFSRTIAGSTKRFAFGTELHALLDAALSSFLPQDDAAPRGPGGNLEAAGIVTNESAIDVLAFMPAVLIKGGRRHAWPAEAHGHGEGVRLTLQNLRGARLACAVDAVVTIENETTWNDVRDALVAAPSSTALVATAGQPNRAVTLLLQLLAAASPQARFSHWGDLDLAGLHILATLRRRTSLPIAPLHMDPATVALHRARGRRLPHDAAARLADAVARRRIPDDLLPTAIALGDAAIWIEQEAVADALPDLARSLTPANAATPPVR